MSQDDDVLLTRRLLRRAALRAALFSAGLTLSVWVLVVLHEGRFVSAPMLLLHGALTGLIAFPLTIAEAAVARRADQGWPLHLVAAALVGLIALVGSSLAWSQVRYTEAMLTRGSLDDGMKATRDSGPITRRPNVATTIFVTPAAGLGLAALLALRRTPTRERLVIAPIAGLALGLSAGLSHGGMISVSQLPDHQWHLVAFAAAASTLAVVAALVADALDERVSRPEVR